MKKNNQPFYKNKAIVIAFFAMVANTTAIFSSVWVPEYAANFKKEYYTIKYTCHGKCKPAVEPSEEIKLLIDYNTMQLANEARPYQRAKFNL